MPLQMIITRVRALVDEFWTEFYFARTLGYSCVDDTDDERSSPEQELDRRVSKPHLWSQESESWTEVDLCDFIEVFHDLAAWPTMGWYHDFNDCGWHPQGFSDRLGQALYRWRMNCLLDQTLFRFRLADKGEDIGRMVTFISGELGQLIDDVLDGEVGPHEDVTHAVALFRDRDGTRDMQRSAIVSLAGILESRRQLLQDHLLTNDEGALFQIANQFDLRHRKADQRSDYATEFLEWTFYWYLATVQLTDRLIADDSRDTCDQDVEGNQEL